jgi:poly(hydroxyalkanoate) granule-associated protein
MVKKTKPVADTKSDNQLAAAVKDSAQQIWLAGLGAFAKAQEEGSKVFENLVKEGRGIQRRTRAMTEEKIGEVTGKVGKVAGDLSKQATESWDRLEQVFEDRVARALNRLGVPTNSDIQELIVRVDALNASVQSLGGKPARAPRAARAPRTAVVRKPAAKAAKAVRGAKGAKVAKVTPVAKAAKTPAAPKVRAPRKTVAKAEVPATPSAE